MLAYTVLFLVGVVTLGHADDVVYSTKPLSQEDYDFIRRQPMTRAQSAGYKYKYVDHSGKMYDSKPSQNAVQVAATLKVTTTGHYEAALIVSNMVKHMPSIVFNRLATRSHGVGIFAHGEGLSSYPEMARTKDTPACRGLCTGSCSPTCTFDGRKWDTVAGSGGSRALVLEDNLMCTRSDPYRHRYNVLIHEFGHTIKFYGVESSYLSKLTAAFSNVKRHHIYGNSYALSNEDEYFAEGTQAFFNVNMQGLDGGLTGCNGHHCKDEIAARQNVKLHTPDLYEILVHTYTNGDMYQRSGLKVCMTQ